MSRFNYIITIHNKEDVLERTLSGVESCGSDNSVIYPVLDGCTDGSEDIVKEFIRKTSKRVVVTKTPDVHEIKSINAALGQIDEGFTICLQDDVILQEPDLEKKIELLYQKEGAQLGVISFCRAANLKLSPLFERIRRCRLKPSVTECHPVKAKHNHCPRGQVVEYENLIYRMVAIKSPVCIPESVLKKVGILDENLAPYSYDDHEYCMRCLKLGFKNALFPLHFISELEWGGTRMDKNFSKQAGHVHLRNLRYIMKKHGRFIKEYCRNHCEKSEF